VKGKGINRPISLGKEGFLKREGIGKLISLWRAFREK